MLNCAERQQATAKEGTVKESGTQLMECETQQTVKGADEHRTSSTDVQKPDTGRGLQTRKGEPVSEASPGKGIFVDATKRVTIKFNVA